MDEHALAESARLTARAAALFVLGQMRTLEERVVAPGERWDMLRRALERFVAAGESTEDRR